MRIKIEFADNGIICRNESGWVEVIEDEVDKYAQSEPICAKIGKGVLCALDEMLKDKNEPFDGANIDIRIKLLKKVR